MPAVFLQVRSFKIPIAWTGSGKWKAFCRSWSAQLSLAWLLFWGKFWGSAQPTRTRRASGRRGSRRSTLHAARAKRMTPASRALKANGRKSPAQRGQNDFTFNRDLDHRGRRRHLLLGDWQVRHWRPTGEPAQVACSPRLPGRDCSTIDGADVLANVPAGRDRAEAKAQT